MGFFRSHASWRFASVLACFLLTACATSPRVQKAESSSPSYTLAIFPWHMSSHRYGESYIYGMFALKGALKTADFLPIYSYYRFRRTPKIPKAIHPELTAIWDNVDFSPSVSRHRSYSDHPSDLGPNLAPAYRLGQQLDVDAVLMYAMDPHYGYDFIWVYLLDIRQRRVYVRDSAVWFYESEAQNKLAEMTRQVFENYVHDQTTK